MAENSKIAGTDRLKRMRWSELERVAVEVGVSLAVIRRVKTRAELRQAISLARSDG